MLRPFPITPADKRTAHAAMTAAAPDLMAEIAALRKAFPKARLTFFQAGEVEFGKVPKVGVAPYLPPVLTDAEVLHFRLMAKADEKRHAAIKRKLKR